MEIKTTHLFFLAISIASVVAATTYRPEDLIFLNCGSTDDSVDSDGREWWGDGGTKARISTGNSAPVKAGFQDPSLPSQVPYMTARVFMSESTYTFPVIGRTQHYIRFHFYPTEYHNLLPDDGLFGVSVVGGVTLLHNFSTYITAQALSQAYIVKEFSIPPSTSGTITVTFSPSLEHINSYAFVNGIEIVSMPGYVYGGSSAIMVGFKDQSIKVESAAVQTMYRLNVGGKYVSPINDSGLGRTWYCDSVYIYGSGFGLAYSAAANLTIEYPASLPEYIAPVTIYETARSMGPTPKINMNYNLTWIFEVDARFTYVVRFHLCELVYTKLNQRVFDIFINNQKAVSGADVIGWTGKIGVPTYKDYAIYVPDRGGGGEEELRVGLHPYDTSKPEFLDAILNGLEVFKINDGEGSLAGSNPILSPMMAEAEPNLPTFGRKKGVGDLDFVVITMGTLVAAGLFFAFCIAIHQIRKKARKKKNCGSSPGMNSGNSGWLPLYTGNSQTSNSKLNNVSENLSSLAAGLCRHFSIAEIKHATKRFDESLVIGVGGFGKVYKGIIDEGTKVAIKRSNPSSEQGAIEFQTEIEMLSKLRHRHLVSLIGYCEDSGEMILVYDYMAHGTLREHLYKTKNPPLPWKQRLDICIGSARGLHYLHTGAKYTIIHRDVKTTNILVDDKWVAKVSDFGLSKTGPTEMNQTHVSTMVKGSFGYLDPEYFKRQKLTEKSDVYSFGVVLFEVLCGRPPLNPTLSKEQVSLGDWALHCQRTGTLHEIVDPNIRSEIKPECLMKFADTAEKCLMEHGDDRPPIGDVLWNLEFAQHLQENSGSRHTTAAGLEAMAAEANKPKDAAAGGGDFLNFDPTTGGEVR